MSPRRQGTWRHVRCRRLATWLAVLAVVVQVVLFELAMAARDAAAADPTALTVHEVCGEHAVPAGDPRAPHRQPTHDHRRDCPFCIARAVDPVLAALPGPDLPPPRPAGRDAPPARARARVRAIHRPGRFRSRSPPRSPTLNPV